MFRALTLALAVAASTLLVATPASACDTNCKCNHGKAEGDDAKTGAEAKGGKATPTKSKKAVEPKKAEEPVAPKAEPSPKQGRLLDSVDQLIAGTCGCDGQADCTCKKGSCKCKKCGSGRKGGTMMFESLKGNPMSPQLPETARYDATAGIFI